MRGQKLKVFGVELDPWVRSNRKDSIIFFRYGRSDTLAFYPLQKIGVIRYFQQKWVTLFWDELMDLRNCQELKELNENLSPEEVMDIVDKFVLRADKLKAFE